MLTHVLDHIAVTNRSALERQSEILQIAFHAEVRHDGRHHAAAVQARAFVPAFGDHAHDLVAIDDAALFIDDDHAVGVAVEGDADVGAHFPDLVTQGFRRGRTAFQIDVEAVRFDPDLDHLGAQLPDA